MVGVIRQRWEREVADTGCDVVSLPSGIPMAYNVPAMEPRGRWRPRTEVLGLLIGAADHAYAEAHTYRQASVGGIVD
jgi:hypothetical protein